MLAHGLAIDPSRTLRCPATSKVSTAPLGHVTSLSFNRRCKEKNKVFINVDRFGFLHFVWLLPFFQTFPLVPAVMNTNFQPNVSMQIHQIQYSFLLCTEKCQNHTTGNCIIWGHGWFYSLVFANHVYDKKILHNQFILHTLRWCGICFFILSFSNPEVWLYKEQLVSSIAHIKFLICFRE